MPIVCNATQSKAKAEHWLITVSTLVFCLRAINYLSISRARRCSCLRLLTGRKFHVGWKHPRCWGQATAEQVKLCENFHNAAPSAVRPVVDCCNCQTPRPPNRRVRRRIGKEVWEQQHATVWRQPTRRLDVVEYIRLTRMLTTQPPRGGIHCTQLRPLFGTVLKYL